MEDSIVTYQHNQMAQSLGFKPEDDFAPTQGLITKWLREVHALHIQVYPIKYKEPDEEKYTIGWGANIVNIDQERLLSNDTLDSLILFASTFQNRRFAVEYDDAWEIAIDEALKILQARAKGQIPVAVTNLADAESILPGKQ